HRKPQQQEQHQRAEHDRRQICDEKLHDQRSLFCCCRAASRACASRAISSASSSSADLPSARASGSGPCPRRYATHLIRREMPASTSSANPTGIINLTGQRTRPPEFDDCSFEMYESMNMGHDKYIMRMAIGSRKNSTPKISM